MGETLMSHRSERVVSPFQGLDTRFSYIPGRARLCPHRTPHLLLADARPSVDKKHSCHYSEELKPLAGGLSEANTSGCQRNNIAHPEGMPAEAQFREIHIPM